MGRCPLSARLTLFGRLGLACAGCGVGVLFWVGGHVLAMLAVFVVLPAAPPLFLQDTLALCMATGAQCHTALSYTFFADL